MSEKLVSEIAALKAERDALAKALFACITDNPYLAGVGAPNRVKAINKAACEALRAAGWNTVTEKKA